MQRLVVPFLCAALAMVSGCKKEQPAAPAAIPAATAPAAPATPAPAAVKEAPKTAPAAAKEAGPGLDKELFRAARAGNVKEVERLLGQGASHAATDPDHDAEADTNALTAIEAALLANSLETVKALAAKGATFPKPTFALHMMLLTLDKPDSPNLELVKLAADQGVDLSRPDLGGDTPMFNAIGRGHVEVVKLLLERGAKNLSPVGKDLGAKKALEDAQANRTKALAQQAAAPAPAAQAAAPAKSDDPLSFTGTFAGGRLGFEGDGYYVTLKDAAGKQLTFKAAEAPEIAFFATDDGTGMPAVNKALLGEKFTIYYKPGTETDPKGDKVAVNVYLQGEAAN